MGELMDLPRDVHIQIDDEWDYIRTTPPLDPLFTIHFILSSSSSLLFLLGEQDNHEGGFGRSKLCWSPISCWNLSENLVLLFILFIFELFIQVLIGMTKGASTESILLNHRWLGNSRSNQQRRPAGVVG
ncbi:hypothetical protein Sjap_018482 [Stephania japonica]|uniref:Uncharacterized protein n=1 Tax=Stephania japonica TaxID=461633 RepID=A0AAP0NJF2_9MAGN